MTSTLPSLKRLFTCGVLAGAAVALSGCVIAPARPYYYEPGPVVDMAPPPPQGEVVGVAPVAGYIWIGGFWGWGGGRHVWNRGRWEAPRQGYHWAPHRWEPVGRGWREHPGHWER